MKFLSLVMSFLVISIQAAAAIHQVPSMDEVRKYIEATKSESAKPLIVFDLDNTVMETTQTIGSDQWFRHLVKGKMASGSTEMAAVEQAMSEWSNVQRITGVKLVESGTPKLIRDLQTQGYIVIGLTARPVFLTDTTLRQVKSLGVRFSRPDFLNLSTRGLTPFPIMIKEGVILVGENNKGVVLASIIEKKKLTYKHVILVDDRQKNVDNMEEALTSRGLTHSGLRYAAADKTVNAFSPAIADKQHQIFKAEGIVISDADAK
jgi:hypothetical protein